MFIFWRAVPDGGRPSGLREVVKIAANYATLGYTTVLSGAPITVLPGETRDSVTDSALIATWSANWTATAPVAGVGNVTGVLSGYLASYPRCEVK